MLDNNQITAAAKVLTEHWHAGTKLGALDGAHTECVGGCE